LAEISDSCIKHGFKIRFFLIVFSLQPIHLSSYTKTKKILPNDRQGPLSPAKDRF
jgi:hypothetical protein